MTTLNLAGGTLALMVPTSAGLIIAADSRMTHIGNGVQVYCDNYYKITEVDRLDRTAFVVTGTGTVWNLSRAITLDDICREAVAVFDITDVIRNSLDHDAVSLDALPRVCVEAMEKFTATNRAFDPKRGQQLFQVAVGTYDFAEQISRIHSFAIHLADDGSVFADDVLVRRFTQDQEWSTITFGECDYLNQQVFTGPGLSFLTERYGRFRNLPGPIKDTDPALAVDFVTDILTATERTTALVPAKSGIGGPVDVILLGKHPRPQRIRWK